MLVTSPSGDQTIRPCPVTTPSAFATTPLASSDSSSGCKASSNRTPGISRSARPAPLASSCRTSTSVTSRSLAGLRSAACAVMRLSTRVSLALRASKGSNRAGDSRSRSMKLPLSSRSRPSAKRHSPLASCRSSGTAASAISAPEKVPDSGPPRRACRSDRVNRLALSSGPRAMSSERAFMTPG